MTQVPDVPADTGLYPIIDIDGHRPHALTDFIWAVTISIAVAGEPHRLAGHGDLTDRGVQFHQEPTAGGDGGGRGDWSVAEGGDGLFWAEPLAAARPAGRGREDGTG